MEEDMQSRTRLLIGSEPLERLARSHVAVFGVGGVGGYAVEALARAGVGALTLIDPDTISLSNMNRQLIASLDTVGRPKAQSMADRIARITPACRVTCLPLFYLPENADTVDLRRFDYVVDAVDTVAAKLELAERCWHQGVPLISAMGAGNKLDPTKFVVTDVFSTDTCPLARVMRRELRRRGVPSLQVVYSTEEAGTPLDQYGQPSRTPGSISYVPGVAGLIIAGVVIRALSRRETV